MTRLADPVFLATPPRAPIEPAAPLDHSGDTPLKPTRAERTFELESPTGLRNQDPKGRSWTALTTNARSLSPDGAESEAVPSARW
jgi:hypothetical protein